MLCFHCGALEDVDLHAVRYNIQARGQSILILQSRFRIRDRAPLPKPTDITAHSFARKALEQEAVALIRSTVYCWSDNACLQLAKAACNSA